VDLDKVTDLAKAVGVTGAAILILAVGIAWKIDKILSIYRDMLNDKRKHELKLLEVKGRIIREFEVHQAQLEQLRKALPPPSGGSK
jgi:Co/Zn/Cd efflux system component